MQRGYQASEWARQRRSEQENTHSLNPRPVLEIPIPYMRPRFVVVDNHKIVVVHGDKQKGNKLWLWTTIDGAGSPANTGDEMQPNKRRIRIENDPAEKKS